MYFDFRYRDLLKLIKKEGVIFGSYYVFNYYWRVEFQQRGSPHIRGMFWLKDASLFDASKVSSIPLANKFVDRFVTTEQNPTYHELKRFLAFQTH